MKLNRFVTIISVCMILALAAGCGEANDNKQEAAHPSTHSSEEQEQPLTPVKVVLDWTPNTNHTGLYAARDLGYYKEQGLDVEIVQAGAAGADAMVASGEVPFGVSYQEAVTQARIQGVPLVSIAAVIQHNTSGFAAPASKNITSPKDFEGKTYGGWGSPVEQAVIESLMKLQQADVSKLKIINIGDADYFTAIKRDIDFAWIFYGWTGIEAELRKEPVSMIYVKDYSAKLDYYTPVLVTNEAQIQNHPELVTSFMAATAKGYEYAVAHPEEAADLLIKAVPELNKELVKASQKWLSPRYQDDAAQWGLQKQEIWSGYSDWMYSNKLIDQPLDVDSAFTNDFLP